MTRRSAIRRGWNRVAAPSLILLVGIACGDDGPVDPVDPGPNPQTGTMQGYFQDDPEVAPSSASSGSSGQATTFTGTMRGSTDVEVSTDAQTWYSLGAPRQFTVNLQDPTSTIEISGSTAIPTGSYRHVRVNLHDLDFVIDAGSVVEGVTLTTDVHMRLGDTGHGIAVRELQPFVLQAGASARVIYEVNSESWLDLESLGARQVPKEAVEHHSRILIVAAAG